MVLALLLLSAAPLAIRGPEPPETTEEVAVALARQVLSQTLGAAEEQLETAAVTAALWPDARLGCPGAAAPPARVPVRGFRVSLRLGGTVHQVRVGAGRAVVCGPKLKVIEALRPEGSEGAEDRPALPPPAGAAQRRLVEQAADDLARRLSIPATDIALVELTETAWPDSSLGCPQPGRVYTQVLREGYRIGLRAGKRIFEYHSGGGTPFLCENPAPR
jgi:biotin carboxyl carrier protein